MALMADLAGMFPHSILVAPRASQNVEGVSTYSADVSYEGYVEQKARMVRDAQGREVRSSASAYLNTAAAIEPSARVTLPAGFLPQSPPIITVERVSDETGVVGTVLRLT